MQFSAASIEAFKYISQINSSVVFRAGKTQRAVSIDKGLVIATEIPDSIPKEFAIGDMGRFLSTISLFKEPKFSLTDTNLLIEDASGKVKTTYVFTDKENVLRGKDTDLDFPAIVVSIDKLSTETLESVKKAASVLTLQTVSFVGDGKSVSLVAHDKKNPDSDKYSVEIGETDLTFNFDISVERLKLAPGTYSVDMSEKKMVRFISEKYRYWIACDSTSKFSR